jgi:hypothetical protein
MPQDRFVTKDPTQPVKEIFDAQTQLAHARAGGGDRRGM